ncbi:MAG: ribonuclease Z [Bacteroidota bacterium]
MFTLIPLGTAGAMALQDRYLPALALHRAGRTVLFDCGEGTQLRMLHAGLKRTRIEVICITHLHGDHVFGLMGLLSTLSLLGRETPLTLVGPEALHGMLTSLPGLSDRERPYPLHFVGLSPGFTHAVVVDTEAYRIEARPLDHRVFTAGYRFEEKPRPGSLEVEAAVARGLAADDYAAFRTLKAGQDVPLPDGGVVRAAEVVGPPTPGASLAYVSDTAPCAGGQALAERATVLYHEATFLHDLQHLAAERGHSTAREAAEVARAAEAERLLLTHFSARYPTPDLLEAEAREVFPNTEAAVELKRYNIDR